MILSVFTVPSLLPLIIHTFWLIFALLRFLSTKFTKSVLMVEFPKLFPVTCLSLLPLPSSFSPFLYLTSSLSWLFPCPSVPAFLLSFPSSEIRYILYSLMDLSLLSFFPLLLTFSFLCSLPPSIHFPISPLSSTLYHSLLCVLTL